MTLTKDDIEELRSRLEDSVIKCSERCLYQSAKWYIFNAFLRIEFN
jgi:anaphase-promoting complex subunit 8